MTNEAFTGAIILMTPTLYRIARGQLMIEADQQDAVQEAIRRSWEKRESLKDERYLQTWVIRILLNACHDIQRHEKRVYPVSSIPDRPLDEPECVDLRDALLQREGVAHRGALCAQRYPAGQRASADYHHHGSEYGW